MEEEEGVGLKEAVRAAKEFAAEIIGDELKYLRVEEVDFTADDEEWRITLGWVEPATTRGGSFLPTQQSPTR